MAGNNQNIFCDDFNNEVDIGQTWTANVTNLATGNFGPTGVTRFGSTTDVLVVQGGGTQAYDGQQLYEMSAYLTTQFDTSDNSDPNNVAIQDTIWDLFSSTAPTPGTNTYLFQAEQNYTTINAAAFNILTDVNANGSTGGLQEFLTGPIATPEPSSVLMLGCGLMFVSTILYRRHRASQKSQNI